MEGEEFVVIPEESMMLLKTEDVFCEDTDHYKQPQDKINRLIFESLDKVEDKLEHFMKELTPNKEEMNQLRKNVDEKVDNVKSEILSKSTESNRDQVKEMIDSALSEKFSQFSATELAREDRIRWLEEKNSRIVAKIISDEELFAQLEKKNEILEKNHETLLAENQQLKATVGELQEKLNQCSDNLKVASNDVRVNEYKILAQTSMYQELNKKFQSWEAAENKIREIMTKRKLQSTKAGKPQEQQVEAAKTTAESTVISTKRSE